MHVFGEFYYNLTPLAPPGKLVVIENRPKYRTSWVPYGETNWYIVPDMEHYR